MATEGPRFAPEATKDELRHELESVLAQLVVLEAKHLQERQRLLRLGE